MSRARKKIAAASTTRAPRNPARKKTPAVTQTARKTSPALTQDPAAGAVTGLLHTKFQINGLLAGILVMTALYSVNLRVMGRSNLPLLKEQTVFTQVQEGTEIRRRWKIGRWEVSVQDLYAALLAAAVIAAVGSGAYAFLRSNLGLAMCATGDNPDMIRALGVDVGWMTTFGLAISNGLVAGSGALLAQYQGFADVQMGIGMLVWGLASVIIGEALVGTRQLGYAITGAIMGSVLFRLLVAMALRWGLNPNDLKLITAAFVFMALVLPRVIDAFKVRHRRLADA